MPGPLGQSAESQGASVVGLSPPLVPPKKPKKTGIILGFAVGVFLLISAVAIVFTLIRARRNESDSETQSVHQKEPSAIAPGRVEPPLPPVVPIEKPDTGAKGKVEEAPRVQRRSGYLVFSAGKNL